MKPLHKVTIHYRKEGRTISLEVPEGEYILRSFEAQGEGLPFSCRNDCCTTCAVKIVSGSLDQIAGIGLSKEMISKGYGLLCIAKATGPMEAITQDEDEVYEMQFGKYLFESKGKPGSPFDI